MIGSQRSGIALVLVLIAVGVATVLAMTFIRSSHTTIQISENIVGHGQARAIAESGLEIVLQEIRRNENWRTTYAHGAWATHQPYEGGTFTAMVVDEKDNDLADDVLDEAKITVWGYFGGAAHKVSSVMAPSLGATDSLLLVVGDAANPSAEDVARRKQLDRWRYGVTLIDDGATQGAFDAAVATHNVIWVSATASASALGSKLVGTTKGVLIEQRQLWQEFGVTAADATSYLGTSVEITDNTHYITETFSTGPLQILTTSDSLISTAQALAGGAMSLGVEPGVTDHAVVTLEAGGDLVGGSAASGRRAFVPWSGDSSFVFTRLSANGLQLLRRSLVWVALPPLGPPALAHWRLDETTGHVAADSMGSNHGRVFGAAYWTVGQLLSALEFDGTNDYVEVPNASIFQVTSALSVTAWVKADSWPTGHRVAVVLRKGEGNPNNWQFSIRDGRLSLMLDVGDESGILGDTTLGTGRWYHVAATWDGTTVKLYRDGLIDNGSGDVRAAPIGTDDRNLYLGGRGGTDKLDGVLDDVRFYDRALSAAEIRVIYDEGVAAANTIVPRLVADYRFQEVKPKPQLVGHWTLDDTGGGGMVAGGNVQLRNDARINSYYSSKGPYGPGNVTKSALAATNQTGSGAFAMDNSTTLFGDGYCGTGGDPGSVFSIYEGCITGSEWAMEANVPLPGPAAPTGMPASQGDVQWVGGNVVWNTDQTFDQLRLVGAVVVTVTADIRVDCIDRFIADGNSRIVIAPGASLVLYANNLIEIAGSAVLNPETSAPERLTLITYGSSSDLHMRDFARATAVVQCDDDIELRGDAELFGSMVTDDAISLLENAKAHLDVDQPNLGISDPPARDSVRANRGFYRNDASTSQAGAAAHTGTAVRFDGSNDFVEIPHHDSYLLNKGAISFWFNADNPSPAQGLFSKDSSGFDTGGHVTVSLASSVVTARLDSQSTSYSITSSPVGGNGWHHVVVCFGPSGFRFYLNGNLVGSNPYVGGLGTRSGGSGNYEPIALGVDTSASGDQTVSGWNNPLTGVIDDLRIYDDALDAVQVTSLYTGGVLGTSTLPGAVVLDTSNYGAALNMSIPDTSKINWPNGGGLAITASTLIQSDQIADKLLDAMQRNHQMTLVADFTPASLVPPGSVPIATCSADSSNCNFAISQKQAAYNQKLRTASTGSGGTPEIDSGDVLTTSARHSIIVTYDRANVKFYREGILERTEPRTGDFSTWSGGYRFALGNESDGSNPWLGTFYRISIYDRAFNSVQVSRVAGGHDPGDGIVPAYDSTWME